ncbi:MAG: inner membrane protein [Patescibacteria group bacterium]|nr:inner membrane protein [Patescibacteria group bacterium]
MFIHLLAGSLVFLLLGNFFGIEIGRGYILLGAFFGLLPDIISYGLSRTAKLNKWAHTHRDNFSHSVFFPLIILLAAILFKSQLAILASLAMFTHPFCDLYGIGWGVKLFYPLSDKSYKLFYDGKILSVWNQKEVVVQATKSGDDSWIKNIYFKPNIVGAVEWLYLIGFLILIMLYN